MTTQGEAILAFLNTAIAEHERVAQEACDGGDGRWHSGWCPDDEIEEGETSGAGVSDERDRTVVYDEGYPTKPQSVHIALHDPASVLRRCAADRKLIAEHQPDGMGGCITCARPEESEEDSEGNSVSFRTATPHPCPTVVALAECYGWTEGER
ncbi:MULTISPECIES: DUF6221 family protein [unclassified Streptomyces]|uniref:DUF6221 family protein n=1 Tax=unclassified Streptomyces TaxID=2593676 RepID=UPI00080595F4|nr:MULTISPECIES: DUF6221 family protein [unclassified Streptomyces]MYR75137.1 hypothetical protein [Streptomyces sp. SID4925]SBU98023.1 hypothetical protein YUMDRAFT_06007 [Streptomyces sp. OspMP-M45]